MDAGVKEIQATEAKAHLAELLRAVERGESFSITRHGRAVAQLVPAPASEAQARREAVERFRALRGSWAKVRDDRGGDAIAARHEGHRS